MVESLPHKAPIDGDKLAIDPHEEYRRARRNSLWWSGICALTALSLTANPNDAIVLEQTSLTLRSWMVLLALMAVSIFMYLGFIRSHSYIVFKHSKGLIRRSERDFDFETVDIISIIDKLKSNIKEIQRLIPSSKLRREDFLREVSDPLKEFGEILKIAQGKIKSAECSMENLKNSHYSIEYENAQANLSTMNYDHWPNEMIGIRIQEDLGTILRTVDDLQGKVASAASDSWDALQEAFRLIEALDHQKIAISLNRILEADDEINSSISNLDKFQSEFKELSENINEEDRMWLKIHDEIPVNLLFVFSMIVSEFRILKYSFDII